MMTMVVTVQGNDREPEDQCGCEVQLVIPLKSVISLSSNRWLMVRSIDEIIACNDNDNRIINVIYQLAHNIP